MPVFPLIQLQLNCLPQCFLEALNRSDFLFYLSWLTAQIYSLTINTLRAETLPGTDSSFFKWTIDTRGHSRKAECVIQTRIHILASCSQNILQWCQSNSLHHIHKYFMIQFTVYTCTQGLFCVCPGHVFHQCYMQCVCHSCVIC